MPDRKVWTREDTVVACALYAVTPYEKIQASNPQICTVAEKLGRSQASLVMRMQNFASLDPVSLAKGHKGLASVSKQDQEVFADFQKDWRKIIEQAEAIVGPLRSEE